MVSKSIGTGLSTNKQSLPCESAVYVNGVKQTTDVSTDVRYELSRVNAEKFYCMPVGNQGTGSLWWAKDSLKATRCHSIIQGSHVQTLASQTVIRFLLDTIDGCSLG